MSFTAFANFTNEKQFVVQNFNTWHYLMKERNQNGRTKTSDCLLYSDVTVSAMLSVILLGMF